MNVTKHARERWVERKGVTGEDNAEQQVLDEFNSSNFIWEDKFGINYYITEDFWIFVVDPGRNAIIAVYEVDYGFTADINHDIADKLLKKARESFDKLTERVQEHNEEKAILSIQKEAIANMVEQKEKELKELRLKIEKIDTEVDVLDAEKEVMVKEFENFAYQLTCSKNYKMDKLVGNI